MDQVLATLLIQWQKFNFEIEPFVFINAVTKGFKFDLVLYFFKDHDNGDFLRTINHLPFLRLQKSYSLKWIALFVYKKN
jgi:hypothetical protein